MPVHFLLGWTGRPSHWPLLNLSTTFIPHQPSPQQQDEQARLSAEKEIRLLRLLQPCPQIVRFVDAALRPGSTANCRVRDLGFVFWFLSVFGLSN